MNDSMTKKFQNDNIVQEQVNNIIAEICKQESKPHVNQYSPLQSMFALAQ